MSTREKDFAGEGLAHYWDRLHKEEEPTRIWCNSERSNNNMSVFRILCGCCLVLGLVLERNPATAIEVFAEAGDGLQSGVPSGTGTLDLLVHTDQTGSPASGPNAFTFDSGSNDRAGLVTGSIGGVFLGYSPIVGANDVPKPTEDRSVRSTSGDAMAEATFNPGRITANAVIGEPAATAAAKAEDPYPVSPGEYGYAPVIDLALDQGGVGGASYFATDSRLEGSLWELAIGSQGAFTRLDDLLVTFVSDPILRLDDALITSGVRDELTAVGGTAHLDAFELFSTTYLVDRPILYGFGVVADLANARANAPEPATLLLFGPSMAGLGVAACWRRRKQG
jgi:hypothetical protein